MDTKVELQRLASIERKVIQHANSVDGYSTMAYIPLEIKQMQAILRAISHYRRELKYDSSGNKS